MKINKEALYTLYMEWVDQVTEECDWKTSFGPEEIVNAIAHILETNPHLYEYCKGLTIEERELSLEERIIFAGYDYENRGGIGWNMLKESVDLDNSIPRKLITITYNDKTIESYE
jgi:hypothetical protein